MSLYQRINKISEKIEEAIKLQEFYKEVPKASDKELLEREKRAMQRLIDTISPNLEQICELIVIQKQPISEFDLSNIPPSVSASDFHGITLLELVTKTEDESAVVVLLSTGEFGKFTFHFDKKIKTFTEFKFEELTMDEVLSVVPCEEIFTEVEKAVKSFEKRIKESKPSSIRRQEFLAKIGG